MKLIFLNRYFFPDHSATSQMLTDLALHLAAGRPVVFVGAPDGEIARQVSQADCGVTVEQGDARGLAAGLVRLADAPAVCERMGSNGRRLFDGALSQTAALAAWVAILDEVQQKERQD